MWKDIFVKRKQYGTIRVTSQDIGKRPEAAVEEFDKDIFTKCPSCGEVLINIDVEENMDVCYKCGYHFRIDSLKRIRITFDEGSIEYFDNHMSSINPLNYPGYDEKLNKLKTSLGINEGVLTGRGKINGQETCFGVMDWRFMMGSMGSVVGEKLARMVERAADLKLPVIIFSVSGGARMQEGMFSLSQMSKVSAALKRHMRRGLLYISVLTDPTTGGVTASFASLGDIIIAEPGATIGFAGKRVIEQTIKQKLPDSFQSAEFLLDHGFVDMIVKRKDMKDVLEKLLAIHGEVVSFGRS
ncbi:acetyl-CoA carboxylase, carboxyltransferase subunit beta [Fonticella tunisiensis]|uniref:Acetyl-coenzyme A carboxylase carboxyl transferase subunit beta n=1 Tax=Fonticella tunisiensis TaxID=1096341 RepID=A0A4R7KA52_9CLOT|nr:acetyl-CoA carboxylase, carboxyltransferase subunit beta [Fonticella tunisiensis]TDT51245.1 acetyl-CoA carboxylase carboxyl transferase subunit beta [Fonticella tunisiensis]